MIIISYRFSPLDLYQSLDTIKKSTAIATNYGVHVAKYIEQSTDGVREMLSYALAIAVAISSLVLFSTAFLMSDIHRQDDFLWSAVGFIYALVLWFCARNITGAVLLGQASASILLVSYSWQTLKLRKALANPDRAQEINNFSLLRKINGLLPRRKSQPPAASTPRVTTPSTKVQDKVTESEIAIPDTASQDDSITPSTQPEASEVESNLPTQKPEEITPSDREIIPEATNPQIGDVASDATQPEVNQAASVSVNETKVDETEVNETEVNETEVNETKIEVKPVAENITSQSVETKTVTESKIAPQPETVISEVESSPATPKVKEATPKPEDTKEDTKETILDKAVAKDSVTPPKLKPESITKTSQLPEETPAIEPKTTDILDSLETVEVAEVLEATPEDISNIKDRDRTNIIEVQTTEIDRISPEKKTEEDYD